MCPTRLNFQSPACQRAISAAIDAASAGLAVFHRARQAEEERRWLRPIQGRPEQPEILGAKLPLPRQGVDRRGPLHQGLAPVEGGGDVLFERQTAAGIGAEDEPLKVDLHASARVRELRIESAELLKRLVGPVASGRAGGEPQPAWKRHSMGSDPLGGIEVLRKQRGRHHQGVAVVREAFSRGAVGGELAGRVEWHAGQVADGIGVLGVVEPPEHDWTGVPRSREGFGLEVPREPVAKRPTFSGRHPPRFVRGHLAVVEHLGDLEPDARGLAHVTQCSEPLKVKIPLRRLGRVAFQAIPRQERPRRAHVFSGDLLQQRRIDGLGRAVGRHEQVQDDQNRSKLRVVRPAHDHVSNLAR